METPVIGTTVYATDSGLGILAKSFWDNGVINSVFVIEHTHHQTHSEWYPECPSTPARNMDVSAMRAWASQLDVFLAFETPFDAGMFTFLKHKGVKTVMMPMYECDHARPASRPHLYVCPSMLDMRYYEGYPSVFLPVPVSVPWRKRERVETFVHNAGHLGLKGRNGTVDLWNALPFVTKPTRLILRCQERFAGAPWASKKYQIGNVEVDYRYGSFPQETLWGEGECFVFPERWNGLSLPLQEAYASGMLVMAGGRFPMNTWLPKEPLIEVERYERERIGPPYNEFNSARYDPKKIAAKMDAWNGRDVAAYSKMGKAWAEANSWAVLKPKWLEVLKG